ncbi:hypothetical protein IMCC1989_1934 [gamma proteobacterium IMCC1989]|nr:hypothetical protein IMCC1989_1934 [gamma proteobacterium IMCC1989]
MLYSIKTIGCRTVKLHIFTFKYLINNKNITGSVLKNIF